MKIIAVGDIHGRTIWKDIVVKESDADKIIFVGDYFDSYDYTTDEQIENFTNILNFKKENVDKVILLIGNHDFHYLKGAQEKYSGFQNFKYLDINEVLEPAVSTGLLQICHIHDNFVFTHAGLTKTWCGDNGIDLSDLENSVNRRLMSNIESFRFNYGDNYDGSGDDVTQPPIWVRIPSLLKDMLEGYRFVVGHSRLKELTIADNLIGIDTLGQTGEYLVIIDGEPSAATV
jgi:predicted phosphodiesterase